MNALSPVNDITAVILAGGKARRLGGEDKGLIRLGERRLIDYLITALRPQVASILINANRNPAVYAEFSLPIIPDTLDGYLGPLAGMASGMQASRTPYIVTAPCDSPFVPATLVTTLAAALQQQQADISVAHDGERMQPVFALMQCKLLPGLLLFLEGGGRKVEDWYAQQHLALADFSAMPEAFLNVNTPQDRQRLEARLTAP